MSSYPTPANGNTLAQAAKILEVGKNTLLRRLRQQGIFSADNIPMRPYITEGYFTVQQGGYSLPGYNIPKHTRRAIVTSAGMRWLGDFIANDPEIKQKAPALRRQNRTKQQQRKRSWTY